MKKSSVSVLILIFALAFSHSASAWGPVSHIALTFESGQKNGFPVSEDLVGAYLAGSTEPDIGLDDGKSEDYGTYHSEDFAKAMEAVALRKKSPEKEILLARAAGMRSHHAGDSAAHGNDGYANAKKMFNDLDSGLPGHTTNELCVDLLMYHRNRDSLKKQSLNFIDVDTLIEVRKEFSKMTGTPLENDREKLKKEILNHRAMVLTELSLAHHLSTTDPAKLDGIKEAYSDLDEGVMNGKGATLAISRIGEQAKPCQDLSNFKTSDKGFTIKEFLNNSLMAKSFQALERGALKFMKSSVIRDNFSEFAAGKVGENARNKAFVNFGVNLLNKNLTFKQAAILAGKATSGYPENPQQKLAYLEIEAETLKIERDRALQAFNQRPWYKFWLYFTNSDKKKYLAAEASYQEKLRQIEQQKSQMAAVADIPVEESEFDQALVESAVVVNQTQSGSDLAELQARFDEAYHRYVTAAASGNSEALKQAVAEMSQAKDALRKHLK
ncbi:MAG: zinc dependent phospholipase C family protein [Candidatus Riflebacteria bacterium]